MPLGFDNKWDSQVRLKCPVREDGVGQVHRFVRGEKRIFHFASILDGANTHLKTVDGAILDTEEEAEELFRDWITTLMHQNWQPVPGSYYNDLKKKYRQTDFKSFFPKVPNDAYLPYW